MVSQIATAGRMARVRDGQLIHVVREPGGPWRVIRVPVTPVGEIGLVVHRAFVMVPTPHLVEGWRVSHGRTGRTVLATAAFPSREHARDYAHDIAGLTDWHAPARRLRMAIPPRDQARLVEAAEAHDARLLIYDDGPHYGHLSTWLWDDSECGTCRDAERVA